MLRSLRSAALVAAALLALPLASAEPPAAPVLPATTRLQQLEWPLAGAWRISVQRDGSGQLAYGRSAVDVWPFPAGTVNFGQLCDALRTAPPPPAADARGVQVGLVGEKATLLLPTDPALPAFRQALAAVLPNLGFSDRRRLERFRRLQATQPLGAG